MNLDKRKKEILTVFLIGIFALIILFVSYNIFSSNKSSDVRTDEEKKLISLLSDMEGVGNVDVAINRTDDETSVVVICEGADNFLVKADVLRAVAMATGAQADRILIYKMSKN